MKIAVFGLGYVGCVSLGCLANNGYSVIGVEINKLKIDLINSGKPTIIEKDIDNLIKQYRKLGSIKATGDYNEAVVNSELALICVGTPPLATGQLDLSYVYQTAKQLGEALRSKRDFYTIAIRSTVMPGTNEKLSTIIADISGKEKNKDFAVVSNPEFLREGSAVNDYYNPSVTVIGTDNTIAFNTIKKIYSKINAPIIKTDSNVAEMIKYVNNTFHALKVTFANEVGVIAKAIGVDSNKLIELFIRDDRLNISSAYLKPGMGYGGSCLPKDLNGLCAIAHDNYINTPVLRSIDESNNVHNFRAYEMVQRLGNKKVGIIGLAFKKGTDDLRYSPAVELVEKLSGKGFNIKIFDKNIVLSMLMGGNKSYIEEKLPHISQMIDVSIENVVIHADTIVLIHRIDEIVEKLELFQDKNIIDLAGYPEFHNLKKYSGIAW